MANKKIRINSHDVTGGPDGSNLIGCYFLPTTEPGKYIFCDKDDNPIVTHPMPVSPNHSFTFQLPNTDIDHWQIPNPTDRSHTFEIFGMGSEILARGSWRSHHNHDPDDDGDGESGTFQAQSGPRVGVEDAASAAKA